MKEKNSSNVIIIILSIIIIVLIIVIGVLFLNNTNQEEEKTTGKIVNENSAKELKKDSEDLFEDDESDNLDEDSQEYNIKDDEKEVSVKYEWEEYPENINSYIEKYYGSEFDEDSVAYSLMKKTLYSLNKNYSDLKFDYLSIVQDILMIGDSTEYIDRTSNYARYCYPYNEANDLSAKISKPIIYDVAVFNGLYYDGYYNLEQCVKNQYESLVVDKDYKHYEDVPKELYYQLDSILIMNGNNESEEDYKANARAKKNKNYSK